MYKGKRVIHIVAHGGNYEIGAKGGLLWSIPKDLQHFKETTLGHVVLMGRKTHTFLPNSLGRRVIIPVSSSEGTLEDFLDKAVEYSDILQTKEIYIAGGAELYNSTDEYVDELIITQVHGKYSEADTFYTYPKGFKCCWDTEEIAYDYRADEEVLINFTIWEKSEDEYEDYEHHGVRL